MCVQTVVTVGQHRAFTREQTEPSQPIVISIRKKDQKAYKK